MKGNIITTERCMVCGLVLKHDERRGGLFCPEHPQIACVKKFIVRFGRHIQRQFNNYKDAARFLNGLRFKTDEGTFDVKDYSSDKPYSFYLQSEKYLKRKRNLKSFKEKKRHIKVAQEYFIEANVKYITAADIDDYLFDIENISEKTRANYASCLHDFFKWIKKRGVIKDVPDFPVIDFELGWRTLTDRETQQAILDKVYEMTGAKNPKVWFGIELLSTYVNLRPGDLFKIREKDIDLKYGDITIHYPTKKKNNLKTVRLIPEHVEIFKQLKEEFKAVPELLFFRHHGGVKSVKVNQPFGEKYFYKAWKAACEKLNVDGLDLYGGTRHTSTTEIKKRAGEKNAKEATEHGTDRAFRRYCQYQSDTAFQMAQILKSDGKIFDFPKKENKG